MKSLDSNIPSNRQFGFFFSVIFGIASLYFAIKATAIWSLVCGVLCLATFITTVVASNRLRPANLAWYKISILLSKVVNPVVLGIIFFVLITPVALIIRFAGRDELQLKLHRQSSLWKHRLPIEHKRSTFNNQF
tara:strand:+ start:980 stop:1381 length:402 start_codon:yes stop_codon:yes gene_type:complete